MELLIGAHDPEGRMSRKIPQLKQAMNLFTATRVAITPRSVSEIRDQFSGLGARIYPGSTQPHETKLALLKVAENGVYCTDLDKILHMLQENPDELEKIAQMSVDGYCIFGRTDRAFETYPDSWKTNEAKANTEMARVLNTPRIDIAVVNFAADKDTVDLLKNQSVRPGWQCAVTMPLDALTAGHRVGYMEFDGYSWEDPDRYREEIERDGFETWKKNNYDSKSQWDQRRRELKDYLSAIHEYEPKLKGLSLNFSPYFK